MVFEFWALLALSLTAWFWFEAVRAREIGLAAVRRLCREEGVQLLDDTVLCRRSRLARNDNGRLGVRRVFEFEYSGSGFERYRGSVVVLGREVEMLDISAHRRRVVIEL